MWSVWYLAVSVLVNWREGAFWASVDGELTTGAATGGCCGVFEPSMYPRMSLPMDRPTEQEEMGRLGEPNEKVRTGYSDNPKCAYS
jgi:hypothetical protein